MKEGRSKGIMAFGQERESPPELPLVNHLVSSDEHPDHPASEITHAIRGLLANDYPEAEWESDLIKPYFFNQATSFPDPLSSRSFARRSTQHVINPVVLQSEKSSYCSYPPIVTNDPNYRLSGGITASQIPWYEPLNKLGQVRIDAWYAIHDSTFWESLNFSGCFLHRAELRTLLPAYLMFPDSAQMLPYIINEYKKLGGDIQYARAYLTFICATILHSRLKLRVMAGMETTWPCEDLTIWCFTTVGTRVEYWRMQLRQPEKEGFYVYYESEKRKVFELQQVQHRNNLRQLMRVIHTTGHTTHLKAMKDEVEGAAANLHKDWTRQLEKETAFIWQKRKTDTSESQKWVIEWKKVPVSYSDSMTQFDLGQESQGSRFHDEEHNQLVNNNTGILRN